MERINPLTKSGHLSVRLEISEVRALKAAARRHGFPSRNAMMAELCRWALNAKQGDFYRLPRPGAYRESQRP